MPRFTPRLAVVSAMLVCGCLARASLFGSSDTQAKRDRDAQAIAQLYEEAVAAEQEGVFDKALELYTRAYNKAEDYDKAHPKDDPTAMQLVRTRCNLQIEIIRFNRALQTQESPIASTPAEPETTTPATPGPGIEIPSRLVNSATRDVAKPPQPPPRPRDPPPDPAMSVADQVDWARDRMELGEPEKALESLREALRVEPDHAGARFLYALACFQCGDTETAETFLDDLALDAPSEAAYLLLGAIRYQQKNHNAALTAVRKAREINPESAAARLNETFIVLDMPGAPRDLATTTYRQAVLLGAPRDPALEARLNLP